jgi:hypothetical protein
LIQSVNEFGRSSGHYDARPQFTIRSAPGFDPRLPIAIYGNRSAIATPADIALEFGHQPL